MQVELRLAGSHRLLGRVEIPESQPIPQPGVWLDWGFGSCLVLLRRHRYTFRNGRYQLSSIALDVKQQAQPLDSLWWKGQWVIGNPQCAFNAHSPLLRCAVLPEGPCNTCSHFKGRPH
ncbi:MAG: DUF6464 family protein [Cyanobacteriota bacterium]|jgi:Family of unknown function (DUF6464)|nr:DUF6464 family protein [Cyanobacteriota bacterium]